MCRRQQSAQLNIIVFMDTRCWLSSEIELFEHNLNADLINPLNAAMKNVLLLIADDLGKQLGCYGAQTCKTPNLDKLASEGTRFTHAFASTASCSASRSTIYTGLHTHQNGQYGLNNGRHHFNTFDNIETAPYLLRKHGYMTGIIGKVHVGPDSVYSWDIREESSTRDVAWVASRAADFFRRSKLQEKQFFLTIGFVDPHRDLTRSGFGNDDTFDALVEKQNYSEASVEIPEFLSDLPGVRCELANYYQSISRLDQGVGLILKEVEGLGLVEETLVIFLSDNGPPFLNSKTTLYDAGVCLPLIVKAPGNEMSIINPNMISYVDILPTILDFVQQDEDEEEKQHPRRLGRSFLSILASDNELPDWSKVYGSHTFHEITNYWPTRFVRNKRYKYHRNIAWRLDFPFAADIYGSLTWEDVRNQDTNPSREIGGRSLQTYFFRPPEELYDLIEDPQEVKNLAGDARLVEVLKEMRADLETWQRQSEDPWLYRDGVSLLLVQHHLDAGLVMPDRWELDAERPDNRRAGLTLYRHPTLAEETAQAPI